MEVGAGEEFSFSTVKFFAGQKVSPLLGLDLFKVQR